MRSMNPSSACSRVHSFTSAFTAAFCSTLRSSLIPTIPIPSILILFPRSTPPYPSPSPCPMPPKRKCTTAVSYQPEDREAAMLPSSSHDSDDDFSRAKKLKFEKSNQKKLKKLPNKRLSYDDDDDETAEDISESKVNHGFDGKGEKENTKVNKAKGDELVKLSEKETKKLKEKELKQNAAKEVINKPKKGTENAMTENNNGGIDELAAKDIVDELTVETNYEEKTKKKRAPKQQLVKKKGIQSEMSVDSAADEEGQRGSIKANRQALEPSEDDDLVGQQTVESESDNEMYNKDDTISKPSTRTDTRKRKLPSLPVPPSTILGIDESKHNSRLQQDLERMTKSYKDMALKYDKLKELRETDAEKLYREFKVRAEERFASSEKVIANLNNEIRKLRSGQAQIRAEEDKVSKKERQLETKVDELQSQVKTLQKQLDDANAQNRMAETKQKTIHDLYESLTGLKMQFNDQSDKDSSSSDVHIEMDDHHEIKCIVSGKHGELTFKLIPTTMPEDDSEEQNSETEVDLEDFTHYTYIPLISESKDSENLMELLPDYLTEEIVFDKERVNAFYWRVLNFLWT
ncbi:hypothetical protein BKA69DRAFT_587362 [Paraphysoderma sedebokerense]|nr:hypothetical protein BKA69DRAFT_587362 [Paraphysoderma sedebokerense]